MAAIGRGTAVVRRGRRPRSANRSARLFDSVADPVAWDLEIDWGGADVVSVEPARLPDLYAGSPVTLRARVRGEVPADLTVRGVTTRGERTFAAPLRSVDAD